MDDPWGSPWGSSDTHPPPPKDEREPSLPTGLLSLPPKAFFGETSSIPNSSPWTDDDDGFGDWAGPDHAGNAATTSTWGTWADSTSHVSQLTPRAESPDRESPIRRPSSTMQASSVATTPNLKPVVRSRASSIFRQASPDPWASVASPWTDHSRDISPVRLNNEKPSSPGDQEKADPSITSKLVIQIVAPEETAQKQGGELGTADSEYEADGVDPPAIPHAVSPQVVAAVLNVDTPSAAGAELPENVSRPSSTFSVDSDRGLDGGQDSPITSVDEDQIRPQLAPRSVSGKVSELVGLFDGLARAASEEPPAPERLPTSRGRSRPRASDDVTDDADDDTEDSGDLDDASSVQEDQPEVLEKSFSSGQSSTSTGTTKQLTNHDTNVEAGETRSTAVKGSSVPVQQLIQEFGSFNFKVNFDALDVLFPEQSAEVESTSDEFGELSDRIITDNFTTIEERKTWYRISRYGSMRKHNSGDEDNYHRVAWGTSFLHADTIKIVRRWMEEDSFSGRATLGGSKRSSVFNWDSSAVPVELDKIFARKPSLSHSKSSSIMSPGHAPSRSMSSFGMLHGAPGQRQASGSSISALAPVDGMASFGWSTNVESPLTSPREANGSQLGGIQKPPLQNFPTVSKNAATAPTPAFTGVPNSSLSKNGTPQIEDDDDWGEMVTSPAKGKLEIGELDAIQEELPTVQPAKVSLELPKSQSITGVHKSPTIKTPKVSKGASERLAEKSPAAVSVNTIQQGPGLKTLASGAVPTSDPWASADFSFFDTASNDKNHRPPAAATQPASLPSNSLPQASNSSDFPTRNSYEAAAPNTAPARVVLGPTHSSKDERAEDELVQLIISNIPDLSYMLR